MGLLSFDLRQDAPSSRVGSANLSSGWSIEVMPRTAAKVQDFKSLLPAGTLVYVAHIAGTPIADMVATARRLHEDGFAVMPHFPARGIADAAMLEEWIKRYRNEAGVTRALLLGGGFATPVGAFDSSVQMIETGLFDHHGFTHLHVAGHPEGNRDIDHAGGTNNVDDALRYKQDFAGRTDAELAIVTQFAFETKAVTDWAERIANMGIALPIHVGIAGPAKLQTLIQFALSCGVGPSIGVLQKRARDLTKLLVPYEPTEVVAGFAEYKARNPHSLISQLHVFPLGGIKPAADWMNRNAAVDAELAAN